MVACGSSRQLQKIIEMYDAASNALRDRDPASARENLRMAKELLVGCNESPASILALSIEGQAIADRLAIAKRRNKMSGTPESFLTLHWIDQFGDGASCLPERLALQLADFLTEAGQDAAFRNSFADFQAVRSAVKPIAASLESEVAEKLSHMLDEAEENFDFTEDGNLTRKGRRRLLDQLHAPLLDWQLPPLLPGDWHEANAEEGAQIVSRLSLHFGRDFDPVRHRIHRVRSLQLLNWDGQAWLLELQGVTETGAPAQIDVIQVAEKSIILRNPGANDGASDSIVSHLPEKPAGLPQFLELARLQLAKKLGGRVYRLVTAHDEPTPPLAQDSVIPSVGDSMCSPPELIQEGETIILRVIGFGNGAYSRAQCRLDDRGRLLPGSYPELRLARSSISDRSEIRSGIFRHLKSVPLSLEREKF